MSRPDMKKYKRERPEKGEKKEAEVGHIMVGFLGAPSQYISKAIDCLEAGIEGKEGGSKKLTVLAGGNAIGKAVTIAEVVKRRVKGLHQISTLTSETIQDKYVARKEGGGDPVTVDRTVPGIKIELSLDALDSKAMGYQAPIDESLVKAEDKSKRDKKPAGRGKGKGGRGKGGRGKGGKKADEWSWLPVRRGGGGRGRGALPSRGRGKGTPSRGKGGKGIRSRGGGGGGGYGGPPRSRGGGGYGGVQRSRGAGSRPYSAGKGGGYRAPARSAPVRSRGGGYGGGGMPRSRGGGGGYGGPPRSRGGGGFGAPPRSRGGARKYAY